MTHRKLFETSPNWYSEEEEFTKPSTMGADIDIEDAVICFERKFYDLLIDGFKLKEEAEGLPALIEGKIGDDIGVFKSYFGSPAAAMLLEALIASGIERVLMLGEAGSIAPKCPIGDIVIPTWGIREEGTSYHYFPPNHDVSPSKKVVKGLENSIDKEVKKGGVWTIDAGFRETKGKINNYAHRGVLCVEMECTALMAVAEYRDIDFASILVITDEVFSDDWIRDFKGERVVDSKEEVVKGLKRFFEE
ncbi:MAG: nucleoside phosphorylase [Thermoplasmata archaeon]